ncbi:hypothetical protein [Mucilaginibacter sp. UR6-11]|uniref:hypothetical protein n=1 Tax=Mucilaginibacter sp. UR6-11 TaxID=1435644 RepID=UPI001E467947|nr:hypothetical protein [Mucilaginibacter sp. UR6-11]MCC8423480.1 hypothetical protein [Mucilaginibacter sp. UR6-11]
MNLRPKNNIIRVLALNGAVLALTLIACTNVKAQNQTDQVHIGIIDPISNHGNRASSDTNNFSLNLLTGVSAKETGLTIAGMANIIRNDAEGVQIAGVSNCIGKNATGAMFAGFINTYGNSKGLAFAGFTNIAKESGGVQFAGFLNKSDDVSSQFAGFINMAKKVKGVQMAGFINIADSSDYAIGIINLIKNGEKGISASIDETLTPIISFRSGGKRLYGIIGVGYNLDNKKVKYAFEGGLGAHLVRSTVFILNAEVATTNLESFNHAEYFKSSLRLLPALKITPKFEIFGGPSFNYVNTSSNEGRELTDKYSSIWKNVSGNKIQDIHIGYNAGIQFLF